MNLDRWILCVVVEA